MLWCYGDMARASSAGIRTSYYISLCYGSSSSSSSFVIPKKSSELCTLLLARARVRQMASGGFAISISGTTNRSEIMDSCNLNVLYNRLSGYLHE